MFVLVIFEVTAHVCGKFLTFYYQVWYDYLHPDTLAELVIKSYADYKDNWFQDVQMLHITL